MVGGIIAANMKECVLLRFRLKSYRRDGETLVPTSKSLISKCFTR